MKQIFYALAGVLAVVLITTTSAVAGSGVGATLNLGQTNGVNAQTIWRGNAGLNAELRLENTGGGPAISLLTPPGTPPFKVTSQAKVGGLNADLVDGVDGLRLWRLGGNDGTSPGTDFLGTTDNKALELKVYGNRALRLEPNATSPNVIGGFSGNSVAAGVGGGTIAGGGWEGFPNTVDARFGSVGGGLGNTAGLLSVVGGGHSNMSAFGGAVAGGNGNAAYGEDSVVAGGVQNTATGRASSVVGGEANAASGNYSFAAGFRAKATQQGSFVWGDSTDSDVTSPGANTFTVRASAGIWLGINSPSSITAGRFIDTSTGAYLSSVGVWTNVSDRALKHDLRPLKTKDVLRRIARMPITSWSYKAEQPGIRHIGPMAQDFYSAFGLGLDDKHITTIDEGGVALAAIQGLYRQNQALQRESRTLRAELGAQNARLTKLEHASSALSR
jgi:Chaperone of endosialidase